MGLFDDIRKESKRTPKTTVKKEDVWEIYPDKSTGLPDIIYQNGKEWFDSDKAWRSPSGCYIMHTGMDRNGNEAIALTTKDKGVTMRKTEDFVETALATDDGVGYAYTDEGNLFILSAEQSKKVSMCEDGAAAFVLTPELCAVLYDTDGGDDTEAVMLKVYDLHILKSWRKKLEYKPVNGRLNYSLEVSDDTIKATLPDGTVYELPKAGQ